MRKRVRRSERGSSGWRDPGLLVAAVGDLLLGARCWGCDGAWWNLCPRCRADLVQRSPYLTAPDPAPAGFPLCATSSPYDPIVRGLIAGHKEEQALGLTRLLGARLVMAVLLLLETRDWPGLVTLVPVPSTPAAVRNRGFDATWAMARSAARVVGRARGQPVTVARLLRPARRVADQSGLDAQARLRNLRGAFRVVRALPDSASAAILVDDVVTTGSSLTEAGRGLAVAQIQLLGAATVAATVRLHPGSGPKSVRLLRTP